MSHGTGSFSLPVYLVESTPPRMISDPDVPPRAAKKAKTLEVRTGGDMLTRFKKNVAWPSSALFVAKSRSDDCLSSRKKPGGVTTHPAGNTNPIRPPPQPSSSPFGFEVAYKPSRSFRGRETHEKNLTAQNPCFLTVKPANVTVSVASFKFLVVSKPRSRIGVHFYTFPPSSTPQLR